MVAGAWCAYLRDGVFGEADKIAGWSAQQRRDSLATDVGIEWARSDVFIRHSAIARFELIPDTTAADKLSRVTVVTTFNVSDANRAWQTRAIHSISATVNSTRVVFTSHLAASMAAADRYVVGDLEFLRLGPGRVDQARARAAHEFMVSIRQRFGLPAPAGGSRIRYLYAPDGDAAALIGFTYYGTEINGFSGRRPSKIVVAGVPRAGELYTHELVHAAFLSRPDRLPSRVEEPLAKALGGTLHRTWPEFLCEERSLLLERESVPDLPSLFAKPDGTVSGTLGDWELAILIDLMVREEGDARLRQWLDSSPDVDSRRSARESVAQTLGITVDSLLTRVTQRYSESAILARCAAMP